MTQQAENFGIEKLTEELGRANDLLVNRSKEIEDQYREMSNQFGQLKADNDDLKAQAKERASEYSDMVAQKQSLEEGVKELKRMLDSPIYGSEKDLTDHDRKAAIELQRRAFIERGGKDEDFKADLTNLVNPADYRSATRKLMQLGIKSKEEIIAKDFTDTEKRAFEAASLGEGFFSPELLGIEIDCSPESAYLLDLYNDLVVNKSTFTYPHIKDYGALGGYDCDAKCDAHYGPEGNITFEVGKTYDFRGVFCLQKKVLQEANYDLLAFIIRAASRSYRINRNRALIVGDGINEPIGWANGGGSFPIRKTSEVSSLSATDVRLFLNSIPREHGNIHAVMHQNTFAYITTLLDGNGRFMFGEGDLIYTPERVADIIRISNYLPDPTDDLQKTNNEFVAGDFIMAAAHWKTAYHSVTKKPLFFEQWYGQSSAWCVKYQFGAEDGGFVGCPDAGRILQVA